MSPQTDRLPEAARWALLFAVTGLMCAGLFLVAEIAVRVRAAHLYGAPATVEDLYHVDQATGLRVAKPNLRTGRITTNSLGFRGPELANPKPAGTLRLAFLGASTTWCGEVSSNEHTWPHLVAETLARRWPDRRIDYVNAAVPGYTIGSMMRSLEQRVAPLEPDVIIIYEATNDLSGELRELAAEQGLIDSPQFAALSWPSRYSLLWELAEKNLRVARARQAAARNAAAFRFDESRLGAGFRSQLRALVDESRRRARIVALATFATHVRSGQTLEQQRAATESALFYMPFMTHESLVRAYAVYNEAIRDVARETGVVLIDDLGRIPGTTEYFVDSVHFSDRGAMAMAERVADALFESMSP